MVQAEALATGATPASLRRYFPSVRGGEGLMVWAGISWHGKTPLIFVQVIMDAIAYTTMLKNMLEPFTDEFYPLGLTFQQDGTPAH